MDRIATLAVVALLLAASPSLAPAGDREEANKKAVVEFYDRALNQKDFEAAAPYFGSRYVQHNPNAPDGIEGEIKRVLADGDYVILHVHAVRTPGERGSAIVDVFKLENGKIVEHWDVVQPIPEKSANGNGMF